MRPMNVDTLNHPETKTLVFVRTGVLLLLCGQNTGHALLTRYSRGILKENYSTTGVILIAEVLKLFVSGYLAVVDHSETG